MVGKPPRRKPSAENKKKSAPRKTGRSRLTADRAKVAPAKPRAGTSRAGVENKEGTQSSSLVLELECRALLALIRKRCPGMLPTEPLTAGTVAPTIQVKPEEVGRLVAVAARQSVLESVGAPVPV